MPRWVRCLLTIVLVSPAPAAAAWPEDVLLSGMTEHGGEPQLDRELLGRSYRQLIMELGTLVANPPATPAETLGAYGFELELSTRFALTEARDRGGAPSPWDRAHVDEDAAPYHTIPTFSIRKGLPLSTEIGAHMGWIGGSATGVFGGWGRVALIEGYHPIPDLALKLGYSGYVGNDELDLGALDLGLTLGTTLGVGRLPGVNTGRISPWISLNTLRVSANATVDEQLQDDIGALRYAADGDVDTAPPIALPQVGAGVQLVSGNAHIRLTAAWAPATIPTLGAGLGVTF
ncbi:MAG TPA: hypothetical protein ENK18_15485 [Deltaproteobacteria bacterium]|nr:hypothetical protein [Deltaproteobacteria bacterium]